MSPVTWGTPVHLPGCSDHEAPVKLALPHPLWSEQCSHGLVPCGLSMQESRPSSTVRIVIVKGAAFTGMPVERGPAGGYPVISLTRMTGASHTLRGTHQTWGAGGSLQERQGQAQREGLSGGRCASSVASSVDRVTLTKAPRKLLERPRCSQRGRRGSSCSDAVRNTGSGPVHQAGSRLHVPLTKRPGVGRLGGLSRLSMCLQLSS